MIAEGVENSTQREWLARHDCATMQGFLVAPGLPEEQAAEFPARLDWANWPPGD